MSRATLDDYRWLIQAESVLGEAADSRRPLPALTASLRKEHSVSRVNLVIEQVSLRRRALKKFSQAGRLFFTPVGLEQATDEVVAGYKAQRFPFGRPVIDLCCGIGGDLMALATRGLVAGLDLDPVSLLLAKTNSKILRQLDPSRYPATVHVGDATTVDLQGFAAWHIDPDRRPAGRRTTHVALHQPDDAAIDRLLAAAPHAAVKLAPGAVLPERWPPVTELEWISRAGECKQLVAWFGSLARGRAGGRRATVLGGSPSQACSITGDISLRPPVAEQVGRYLFEPDAAVLAAGLTGALAAEQELAAVSVNVAYLTGDTPVSHGALASFEILESLPFDMKRVRALLRARGIGRLEIKKRGFPLDPAQVRRQLKLQGEHEAVLLMAPVGGSVTAFLARRVGA